MAAEPTVVELVVRFRMLGLEIRGDEHHIAMAIDVVEVGVATLGGSWFVAIYATPVAVGYGVAYEYHMFPFGGSVRTGGDK